MNALKLAILFHETYERLAPSFGYETRDDTKKFDENSKNGKLMVAVCNELLPILQIFKRPVVTNSCPHCRGTGRKRHTLYSEK